MTKNVKNQIRQRLKYLNSILDDLVEAKDVDDFLSLSPESLRLDSETEEVITNFLTSEDLDLDDLSTSSSDVSSTLNFSDLVYGALPNISNIVNNKEEENNNNGPAEVVKSNSSESIGYCSVCTLVFANATLLDKHKQEFEDRISCCHCMKTFTTLSKLKTHHRKHSKEKPFKCQICGKYYTHRNTLARHQLLSCQSLKIKTEGGVETTHKIKTEAVETTQIVSTAASEVTVADHLTRMILEAEVVLQDSQQKQPPIKRKTSSVIESKL